MFLHDRRAIAENLGDIFVCPPPAPFRPSATAAGSFFFVIGVNRNSMHSAALMKRRFPVKWLFSGRTE
jgi:hypothetical protein